MRSTGDALCGHRRPRRRLLSACAAALVVCAGTLAFPTAGGAQVPPPGDTWTGTWKAPPVIAGAVLDNPQPRVTWTESTNDVTGTYNWSGNGSYTATKGGLAPNYISGTWTPQDPQSAGGRFVAALLGTRFRFAPEGVPLAGNSVYAWEAECIEGPCLNNRGGVGSGSLPTRTLSYRVPARFKATAVAAPTPQLIQPTTWPVDVTVLACDQSHRFRWTIDAAPTQAQRTAPCRFRLAFPQEGVYEVAFTSASADGRQRATGRLSLNVQDWLVVGLGDSLSSGESVPDRSKTARGAVQWKDRRCHRSNKSYQAVAARDLEKSDPQTSVTFVHLACSGASVPEGLLGPYAGIEPADPANPVPAQLDAMSALVGRRAIDALALSIGVNDLSFGPVVAFCWKPASSDCQETDWTPGVKLRDQVPVWLRELGPRYDDLAAQGLFGRIQADRVYLMEYMDPLHDQNGTICSTGSLGVGINGTEAQWLFTDFLGPLDASASSAASAHAWRFVGGPLASFARHGYCSTTGWITTFQQSFNQQGNVDGTLHPNATGHVALAQHLTAAIRPNLYPGGVARPAP
jgi:lysophospholipase L1-like esterase